MTDDEIIKALKCCMCGNDYYTACMKCPIESTCEDDDTLLVYALDLINRQKAEIDKLENELMKCKLEKEMMYQTVEEIKSEAIKEFADRLKNIADKTTIKYVEDDDKVSFLINEVDLDNLVKEMTENDFKEE